MGNNVTEVRQKSLYHSDLLLQGSDGEKCFVYIIGINVPNWLNSEDTINQVAGGCHVYLAYRQTHSKTYIQCMNMRIDFCLEIKTITSCDPSQEL